MSNFLPKNWSWTLHKKFTGLIRESSWNSIWLRNKTVIYKVVTYGRWSLTRSGGYERIDCTDFNVEIMSADWRVTWVVKELKFSYSRTLEPCKLDIVLLILLTTVERGLIHFGGVVNYAKKICQFEEPSFYSHTTKNVMKKTRCQ